MFLTVFVLILNKKINNPMKICARGEDDINMTPHLL